MCVLFFLLIGWLPVAVFAFFVFAVCVAGVVSVGAWLLLVGVFVGFLVAWLFL